MQQKRPDPNRGLEAYQVGKDVGEVRAVADKASRDSQAAFDRLRAIEARLDALPTTVNGSRWWKSLLSRWQLWLIAVALLGTLLGLWSLTDVRGMVIGALTGGV